MQIPFLCRESNMASTKFYLDMRGRAADGKGTILIHIFHNQTMTTVSTGIRCAPQEWDGERIKLAGSEALNASLQEKKGKIDKAIALLSLDDKFERMSAAEIKASISGGKPKKIVGHLVSDLFAEYLSSNLQEGTKEIYRATLSKVLSFGGNALKMENIDLKWLHQFECFLSKTQGVNGRAIYLRSLRAVCNYSAHQYGLGYPFANFSVKQEPTRKRSVSIDLFGKFLDYPTTATNERYRDYFLLMFYLIGINSKDLLLVKKESVVGGRLEYIRSKTHKKYSIRIEPEAEELLKKYEGKNYLLEAMDRCVHYKSFAHEMNDALKTIGETRLEMIPDPDDLFAPPHQEKVIYPIIPEISTYYARHCWATFAYEAGVSLDVISQALGHSSGNRTTLIYVKFDQEKVDRANRTVIDYLGRNRIRSQDSP